MIVNEPLSVRMIRSVKKKYTPGMMQWHYEHGLILLAALKTSSQYPSLFENEQILSWINNMYNPLIKDDGSIATYVEGEYNLDQINAGRLLIPLLEKTGDPRFQIAIGKLMQQIRQQPRCTNGVFWHKGIYPWQIWLDGQYMVQPFRAEWAFWAGVFDEFDDIFFQLITVYSTLKDIKTGLLHHAWDESRGQRWADKETGLSPHFWSRAIGWFCMALVEILEITQKQEKLKNHPSRSKVLAIFKKLCSDIREHQSDSGMWYQVIDLVDSEDNYLETSASSMFAYCFLHGYKLGYLDHSFFVAGERAIDDIFTKHLSIDDERELHLGGICSVAGLGGNPYRDGSLQYYFKEKVSVDDFKGVGPFILACLAKEE